MTYLARSPQIPPISEYRRFFVSPEIGGIGGDDCTFHKLRRLSSILAMIGWQFEIQSNHLIPPHVGLAKKTAIFRKLLQRNLWDLIIGGGYHGGGV